MAASNRTEFAVLGLLALGARSGYDIKKMADEGMGHFWNENFGHIYPVLKRLNRQGLVTSAVEPQEGRPDRTVYVLTPQGHEHLQTWFAMPIEPVPPRDELLLKLSLGPLAKPGDLIRQIEDYRDAQQARLADLNALAEVAGAEEAHNPRLAFWLLTVDQSRAVLTARVAWAERTLSGLRTMPEPGSPAADR